MHNSQLRSHEGGLEASLVAMHSDVSAQDVELQPDDFFESAWFHEQPGLTDETYFAGDGCDVHSALLPCPFCDANQATRDGNDLSLRDARNRILELMSHSASCEAAFQQKKEMCAPIDKT